MGQASGLDGAARVQEVPSNTVINVEHPGVVHNVDNAVRSLGGESRLAAFLNDPPHHQFITCKLRPEDPFRQGIPNSTVEVSDVVLRINVPKRTGRKRKRGSSEPFAFHSESRSRVEDHTTTECLVRSLHDCPGSYRFEPIGIVDESHRFRRLPDFQYSLMTSDMAKRLTKNILSFKYNDIKKFELDTTTHGLQYDMDLIPPPSFAPLDLPFNYQYLDNPNSSLRRDAPTEQSHEAPPSLIQGQMQFVKHDVHPDEIPSQAQQGLTPEAQLPKHIKTLISKLREVLIERPVITRRVALNLLSHKFNYDLRMAAPYVSYMFRSGPFRDCYVRLGVDPRASPDMRIFQALSFKVPTRAADEGRAKGKNAFHRSLKTVSDDPNSRLFDGQQLHTDGKVWQVIDCTDAGLKGMFETSPLRHDFELKTDGWFPNGTWAKAKVIMKDKIERMVKGTVQSDDFYEPLLQLPAELENDVPYPISRATHCEDVCSMATMIRSIARMTYRPRETMSNLLSGRAVPSQANAADADEPGEDMDVDDEIANAADYTAPAAAPMDVD